MTLSESAYGALKCCALMEHPCQPTATFLRVREGGRLAGRTTLHMTTQEDLEYAIACDRALSETTQNSEAALSPLEDLK